MNHSKTSWTHITLTLVVLSGCTGEPGPYPNQADTRAIDRAPEPIVIVRGGVGDSILLKPGGALAVKGDRIGVIDFGRMAIEMFTTEGDLLWIAGKLGDGPSEFREPEGVAIDEEGRTWVLDRSHMSVTPIDEDGRMGAPFPLPLSGDEARPTGLMVVDDGKLLFTLATTGELGLWDPTTSRAEIFPNPWTSRDEHDPMSLHARTVQGPGRLITQVLSMGGGFQSVALGDEFDHLVPFVERTPIPSIRTDHRRDGTSRITIRAIDASYRAAIGSAIAGSTLYVLYEGATRARRRLIDRYEVPSGRYLGSWELPERAVAIGADGDILVTLEGDLIPKLVIRKIPQTAPHDP